MKIRSFAALAALGAFMTMGCERKTVIVEVPVASPTPVAAPVSHTKTLETSRVGAAIDTFNNSPTAENRADVKKAFADLDGEIAELESLVARRAGSERAEAAAKLKNLQQYRAAESVRFTAAQAKAPLASPARVDDRTGAEKVENSAKRVGNSVEDGAKRVGDAIKDIVR